MVLISQSIGFVDISWLLQLHFKSFDSDLKSVHSSDGGLSTGGIIKTAGSNINIDAALLEPLSCILIQPQKCAIHSQVGCTYT